jgi:hypothetical protein
VDGQQHRQHATVVYFERFEDRNTAVEPDTVTIRIERYRTWPLPNENRGSKTINCDTAGSGNWGDVKGGYAFVIETINGNTSGGRVDIPYVRVSY